MDRLNVDTVKLRVLCDTRVSCKNESIFIWISCKTNNAALI